MNKLEKLIQAYKLAKENAYLAQVELLTYFDSFYYIFESLEDNGIYDRMLCHNSYAATHSLSLFNYKDSGVRIYTTNPDFKVGNYGYPIIVCYCSFEELEELINNTEPYYE
jgi:hypothetical protein